jgi:hypothetical protein
VRVLANWLAEASQGGYWQAAADGLAEERGVIIEMACRVDPASRRSPTSPSARPSTG